jgi:hypothetical protein
VEFKLANLPATGTEAMASLGDATTSKNNHISVASLKGTKVRIVTVADINLLRTSFLQRKTFISASSFSFSSFPLEFLDLSSML